MMRMHPKNTVMELGEPPETMYHRDISMNYAIEQTQETLRLKIEQI